MFVRLKKPHSEIEMAFDTLPGGPTARCPVPDCVCCGEVWGYMGTYCINGVWKHEFRHRHFDGKGRKCLVVDATDGWKPENN